MPVRRGIPRPSYCLALPMAWDVGQMVGIRLHFGTLIRQIRDALLCLKRRRAAFGEMPYAEGQAVSTSFRYTGSAHGTCKAQKDNKVR